MAAKAARYSQGTRVLPFTFVESKNDGLLSRKMLIDWKIWFYKNLRKKDVESAWQSVETGV